VATFTIVVWQAALVQPAPTAPRLVLTSADGRETIIAGPGSGSPRLVVMSDRDGARHAKPWVAALQDMQPDVPLIEVAHLVQVPAMIRPFVRRGFRGAEHVLLDWKGRVAARYGFTPAAVNVYFVDDTGRLIERVSGRVPGDTLAAFIRRVAAALDGR
jgi:hypothetical protein